MFEHLYVPGAHNRAGDISPPKRFWEIENRVYAPTYDERYKLMDNNRVGDNAAARSDGWFSALSQICFRNDLPEIARDNLKTFWREFT